MATSDQTHTGTPSSFFPSPVALGPVLVERIWGVQDLQPWFDGPVTGGPVGEIWLTAENCVATTGPEAGRTLGQLTAAAPQAFGDPHGEGFPLLMKLLFPREKLSVQVHPDDTQARALGMPRGKTECWYVLSANPGAQVAVGFRDPLSGPEIGAAIADGTLESKLRMIPVQAGDMVFVDAGTVHAIGPGMVVLETQQYSDTTYRLWDYGRPRELHIEAGTAVTRSTTAAGLVAPKTIGSFTRLVACQYFAVDRFKLKPAAGAQLADPEKLQILIALNDGCSLEASGADSFPLPRAQAVVVPAGKTAFTLQSREGAEVIRVLQP